MSFDVVVAIVFVNQLFGLYSRQFRGANKDINTIALYNT